ncbi:MAG: rRNA maturation RNase YbeY [Legionellales bacterium RIFCSPHIGHO2_12_FULL_42_9]|nr:MAG: rRNA maturation RNase YbeY [Legionellales bacterium RIFCSPHIGHO2_12_FULL_42_9]
MNYKITIQTACPDKLPVNGKIIKNWVKLTLEEHIKRSELTVRLVTMDEITNLNRTYRGQNKPTNVLAFPSHLPNGVVLNYPLLGDVVICPAILEQEATAQYKPLTDHWAHIVIHGVLHLLGFDHIERHDEERMQATEIELLTKLKITNPYQDEDNELE